MADLGTPLPSPPADGITCLAFLTGSDDLLVSSSWDGTLRLYSTTDMAQKACITVGVPLLGAAPASEEVCFSAALDGKIRSVQWYAEKQLVVSVGWDARLYLWADTAGTAPDADAENQQPPRARPLKEFALPGKAYATCLSQDRLVVATAGRQLAIFNLASVDVASPGQFMPEQIRESPLKHQTRVVQGFPDGSGFAVGSVEGKVAMEYFDLADSPDKQSKAFSFKCHRDKDSTTQADVLYAVNAIAFHPRFGTFATGGGDGSVFFWDGESKSRLKSLRGYPTSISALAFAAGSGTRLAIAASYGFEKGDVEHPADAIYIRQVLPEEITPKSKKNETPAAVAPPP